MKLVIVVSHPYSSPNHNFNRFIHPDKNVVSHPYSSPNHNSFLKRSMAPMLYLILIHHQTTTCSPVQSSHPGCISSLFITKPQLSSIAASVSVGCISSLFITKPQLNDDCSLQDLSCISSLFITKPQPIFSNSLV